MMTRETKAGLVVSCSFLCLVGVVLVSKLREASHPDGAAETSSDGALVKAPAEPQPVHENHADSSPQPKVADNNSPVPKTDKHQPEGKITPAAFKGDDIASILPGAKAGAVQPVQKEPPLAPKSLVPSAAPQKENTGLAIDDTFPTADGEKDKANTISPTPAAAPAIMIAQPSTRSEKSTILNWVPERDKKKATSLQGMGLRPPSGADASKLVAQLTQPSGSGRTDIPQNSVAGSTKPLVDLPPLPPLERKQEAQPDTAKNSKPLIMGIASVTPAPGPTAAAGTPGGGTLPGIGISATTPNSDSTPKAESTTPAPAALTPQGNSNDGKSPATAGSSAPTGDPSNSVRSGLVGIVPAPDSKSSGQDKSAGLAVHLDPPVLAPSHQIAKEPSSPSSVPAFNEDSSNRSRAPLGAPIPAVSPIVAPTLPASAPSSTGPQVDSYDEDTYTCRANDTFRSVSQAVYRTDAYDQALLLFNRNHPLANEAIKQNPPLLQAGQPIYIPPLQILRKYYAASIADTNNSTPARSPVSNETANAIQPVTPPASGSATATASTRTYRVGGVGETIRDIARRTLGNGDRWTEIYQLNRGYDPMYAVPAGAELRLPADARVDAQ